MNIIEENCKCCKNIYKNPLLFKCCSSNICKQHLEEMISSTSRCPQCKNQQTVEKEIFEQLKIEFEKLESFQKHPENLVYEEISEFKKRVDLEKERLKSQIDTIVNDFMQDLESYEKKFTTEYQANIDLNDYNGLVESSRAQLIELEKFLKLNSIKNEEREEKSSQREQIIDMLQSRMKKAKNTLLSSLLVKQKPIDSIENGNRIENMFRKLVLINKVRF